MRSMLRVKFRDADTHQFEVKGYKLVFPKDKSIQVTSSIATPFKAATALDAVRLFIEEPNGSFNNLTLYFEAKTYHEKVVREIQKALRKKIPAFTIYMDKITIIENEVYNDDYAFHQIKQYQIAEDKVTIFRNPGESDESSKSFDFYSDFKASDAPEKPNIKAFGEKLKSTL